MHEGGPANQPDYVDAVVVGAGFAGLYMLHRLRGLGLSVLCFEAGSGVGGTWYWNRYPGARCDIESLQYSYSFSPELDEEWSWTDRYARQPEILAYLDHVADRFDVRQLIRFDTRVVAAQFDEAEGRWTIETDRGDRVSARYCVMATGCLSTPRRPEIPGLESFAGRIFQTAQWPHEGVSFAGERVGVIGTGSSGIQSIPVIAGEAEHLTVFQRTPAYSVPARNGPLPPEQQRWFRENSTELRASMRNSPSSFLGVVPGGSALAASAEERRRAFEAKWTEGGLPFIFTFEDLILSEEANRTAADFLADKIRSIVADPVTADRLTPRTYPVFTKRLCVDTGYFETFNQSHVDLVDIRETPITEIVADGVRTSAAFYPLDSIVLATGFDAMTGTLAAIAISGRDGQRLKDKWAAGPRAYLGLMTAGFPNLFFITGPGSPSVLSNMILSIEQHVEWIAGCIADVEGRGGLIEADGTAEDAWVAHVNELADATLFPRAASWYMGANVPGKPRVFMAYAGGIDVYRQTCEKVAANGYEGFVLASGQRDD